MRDMNRHMEDLDNRGRRQNLRVRGLPESVEGDLISQSVVGLFNSILDRPPQTDIDLVRIHRALRPKGKEADPPRDVICCLADFRIKEDILRKARGKQLSCQGAPIQLFQDLSGITLKHCRDLRPLLNVLRDRNISYKWKFPFCLSASHQGRTVLLKVPEDLPHFCDTLGIPLIAVPDWYAMYRQSVNRWPPQRTEPMETQSTNYRRRRSPSESELPPDDRAPGSQSIGSTRPAARRARRDH